MRIMNAFVVLAISTAVAACSSVDSPTAPIATGGPALGLNAQSPNGAWVFMDAATCGMPGSDASGNDIFGGVGTMTTVVENNNKLIVKCAGSGILNLSGRTQAFRDLPCAIWSPKEQAWKSTEGAFATVTREGDATMTCIADV